jgi:PAS domain S-box-containing protein
MTLTAKPPSPLLDSLCQLVEEMSGSSLCSILLCDPDGNRLWYGAGPSLPASYISAIDGSAIDPALGPCARAAYFREPVIVSDFATDPMEFEYRALALAHGLRACWSTPILSSNGSLLGTFAIYSGKPRSPTAQFRRTIEQITHLLATAIERKRTEEALRESEEQLRRSEAYLAEAQKLSLTGSFGWNVSSGKVFWSDETFRILGYDRTTKPTLDLALGRVHAEDMAFVTGTLDRATRDRTNLNYEHRLKMPDGAVKHVHVVARAVLDGAGNVEFVGAVMDVTERKRAEEALRISEHLARGQLTALTRMLDSFAQESDPDKLLEHVLRTIVEQSDAHSVSVWDRNEDGGWLDLMAVIEDGRFQTPPDALHPAARFPILAQDDPVWREVLSTGQHAVLEDIDQESARMRVGPDPAIWYRTLEDADPSPATALLKKHLRAIGVVSVLFVPMLIAGRVAGIIGVRFRQKRVFRDEEIELTRALAHQSMLAIQLIRLSQQSRQVALEAERNRMARDIHDTLAQAFTGVIVQLEAAADATSKGLTRAAEEHLGRAGDLARESLNEARRSVLALRPQALEGKDLCEALEALIRKMTAGTSVRAEFSLRGAPRKLRPDWEENLLHVGQEVLTNALRHAHATHFAMRLIFDPHGIRMELRDNGRGFDPDARHDGIGLLGMKERVEAMGGQLFIQSTNGKGTAISIALPSTDSSRSSAR